MLAACLVCIEQSLEELLYFDKSIYMYTSEGYYCTLLLLLLLLFNYA